MYSCLPAIGRMARSHGIGRVPWNFPWRTNGSCANAASGSDRACYTPIMFYDLARFRIHKSRQDVDRAVSRIVRFAYGRIPHYRRAFDHAGVTPDRVKGVADLPLLPLTRRDELSDLAEAECTDPSVDLSRCFRHPTSGSTGKALTVYMRPSELRFRQLLLGRVLWNGAHVRPPVRIVEIGRVMWPGRKLLSRIPGLLTIVKPPGQAHPTEVLRYLMTYRPQVVQGFPTALEAFAQFCVDQSLEPPHPRVVISRGETLLPETRRSLEVVFHARVLDLYNCEEVGNIAWQCPVDPSRMHVNQSGCVVEIVNTEGQPSCEGETGLIVLTNLFNHTMPFVRYVVGDRGRLLHDSSSSCACGASGPALAPIDGRAEDTLLLPDGTWMSPRVAATVLIRRSDGSPIHGLRRFQILQEEPDRLRVRVALADDVDSDWLDVLTQAGARGIGGVHIDVEQVSEIPFESSGKFKRVISTIRRRP